ncbi:MAG: hypothetical protein ABL958_09050 [Bdellovibrionia bacterium]
MVKFLTVLFFPAFAFALGSAGVEEQRKYVFENSLTRPQFEKLLKGTRGDFRYHYHSDYFSQDVYWDTKDQNLKNAGLSLRLRRVKKGKAEFAYAFQIKSEMSKRDETRMEIEYKDFFLEFSKGRPVTDWINEFFDETDKRPQAAVALTEWFETKKGSSLGPIQELRRRGLEANEFEPRLINRSERVRFHIYVDSKRPVETIGVVKQSAKEPEQVPEFFKKHSNFVWTAEGSLDFANFEPVAASRDGKFQVIELEIENKYRPRDIGSRLLEGAEKSGILNWNGKPSMESKYARASSRFFSR